MSWGGHLNLHVGGNRRRNHWLLALMLVVAVTLLRWLLMLLMLVILLLLRMRSDLRMGRSARHCHRNSGRLWRHWGLLLQFLARLDFRFCHCGSGQLLMAALPTALRSILDLGMCVALGDTVSGRS